MKAEVILPEPMFHVKHERRYVYFVWYRLSKRTLRIFGVMLFIAGIWLELACMGIHPFASLFPSLLLEPSIPYRTMLTPIGAWISFGLLVAGIALLTHEGISSFYFKRRKSPLVS